ncbi:MAG: TetR/AcrR family transcriptional regulator [Deltaproteobacteria bacterium]|uniref:TetR/AcrR family transcriptional regulator n=1 Tax=Desulfobacula sp. TaxID=2593537 RepID=UPI00198692A7|nr:TetR/AcrR family transcriptional regulator [Candidatus Desulfobacula maris]MBL6993268.1 TetR family transcriptional regulator [Desulfobacula sp.]
MGKETKRNSIRDIAARVFAKNGFERTTIRGIAEEGGISAASIYYYFDSKEELLYQILDETMSTGLELIRAIEKKKINQKEKLIEILRMHTMTAIDFDKMKLLVHEQNYLTSEHRDVLILKQKIYMSQLTKVFQSLKEDSQMRDLDPKVCAFAFFGMVSWAYRWFNPDGDMSTQQLADNFTEIFTKGIFLNPE